LAAIKDRDIAARSKGNDDGIGNDDVLQLLQSMVKQRRESISMYEKGGRMELAEAEKEEIEIIQAFLPKQFDDAEIKEAVATVISEISAQGIRDMGKVMAALREKYAGQMDFGKASAIVKQTLAG
jgi:uncharacterized protein YqeY